MLYGDHLVFKIPGDEIVGNETIGSAILWERTGDVYRPSYLCSMSPLDRNQKSDF